MTRLYAATGNGIARLDETEGRWDVEVSLNGSGAQCLAVDPADADTVYAGLRDGGVRKTTDGGRSWQALAVAPWKLPLVVIAIAVPIVAAFYLGGPGVGVAMGALVAVAIVVAAVRQAPRGPIGRVAADGERRVLVVLGRPAEEPEAIQGIAAVVAADRPAAETLVLSPARLGFFDRWASDVEGARRQAQQRLVSR